MAQAHRSGSPEMGLSQDLRVFSELVQQAASAGSADALFALGGGIFHGEDGFARDPRAAFRCESRALLCFVFLNRLKKWIWVLANTAVVYHRVPSIVGRNQ